MYGCVPGCDTLLAGLLVFVYVSVVCWLCVQVFVVAPVCVCTCVSAFGRACAHVCVVCLSIGAAACSSLRCMCGCVVVTGGVCTSLCGKGFVRCVRYVLLDFTVAFE